MMRKPSSSPPRQHLQQSNEFRRKKQFHQRQQQLQQQQQALASRRLVLPALILMLVALWLGFILQRYSILVHNKKLFDASDSKLDDGDAVTDSSSGVFPDNTGVTTASRLSAIKTSIPTEFDDILYRARERRDSCQQLDGDHFKGFDVSFEVQAGPFKNETLATLPTFGIIQAIENYKKTRPSPDNDHDSNRWKCTKPHRRGCDVYKFSVVFMAYNPDRMTKTFNQIQTMLLDKDWSTIVEEVVLVWNGERHMNESSTGREMLEFEKSNPFRISYPLLMGFPNDLLNRYHPDVVNVTARCILYYDDDGPFYSFDAVRAGFELWKRHATAQVGAMARQITMSKRQGQELSDMKGQQDLQTQLHSDRLFVSHCDNLNDQVDYNFRYFANYDANMVLPSGSFLHANYLCYIWHPVLEEVRQFVRAHPVHPDDMTVSLVVSQVAGRAPRVYSRRLKAAEVEEKEDTTTTTTTTKRKLLEDWYNGQEEDEDNDETEMYLFPQQQPHQLHRKLLFSIDWDDSNKMNDMKKYWAALRTQAINSLVRYFGSLNSGSIGWCEDTSYYKEKVDGRCDPAMARIGWLPWMEKDGSPKKYCP